MSPVIERSVAVATLTDGSDLATPFWRISAHTEGATLLVIAAQHGNELHGCEVVWRFAEVCVRSLQAGAVYFVPFANIPALRHRRSHASLGPEQPYAEDGGQNMNRTWPGRPDGNDTERVAHAIHETVARHCTHVLDIHSWSRFTASCALAQAGHAASEQMAELCALRFIHLSPAAPAAPDGRTMLSARFNDDPGRAGVTIELALQWAIRPKEVAQGLRAATNIAKSLGLLPGEVEALDGPIVRLDHHQLQKRLQRVLAPCAGLFVEAGLETADRVEEGHWLGHILRDDTLDTVEVVAPAAGYLWQYGCFREHSDVGLPPQHPYASPGDTLAGVIAP